MLRTPRGTVVATSTGDGFGSTGGMLYCDPTPGQPNASGDPAAVQATGTVTHVLVTVTPYTCAANTTPHQIWNIAGSSNYDILWAAGAPWQDGNGSKGSAGGTDCMHATTGGGTTIDLSGTYTVDSAGNTLVGGPGSMRGGVQSANFTPPGAGQFEVCFQDAASPTNDSAPETPFTNA